MRMIPQRYQQQQASMLRACCCNADSLVCRDTGLHVGCADDNMLCSARFALCANELEFGIAAIDTGATAIILTRQTEYYYKYEEAGVRKYELRFRNAADNADGFFTQILRVFQWEGSPAAWVQKRSSKVGEAGSMWAASQTFNDSPNHGTSFGEIEIATVLHYRMWSLDGYHGATVSASVSGINICLPVDQDRTTPCRTVTINGVQRSIQIKSLSVAGPVTLTRNYAPTGSPFAASDCLYQGVSGTATFRVFAEHSECSFYPIISTDGVLSEVTFDLLWTAYLTGNGSAVQLAVDVYSSDADDTVSGPIFTGSKALAELKPRCEGETVSSIATTLVCVDDPGSNGSDHFVNGGTGSVVFPAVGT